LPKIFGASETIFYQLKIKASAHLKLTVF